MASNRATSWDVSLGEEFAKLSEKALVKKRLELVTYLLTRIIQRSPVDTGAFRGNHRVSVGAADGGVSNVTDKGGSSTLSAGISVAAAASALSTIYVQNNLPYAEALEYGHSQQAPQGIYRLALEDTKAHFNELS